ncbi:MAG: hypothetical protein N4A49_16185 [Marinifilaceae bacterium]|jgi:hypothetical protein|nr:hypothetical protein [Marinifilaceae bacterium]
MDELGNIVYIFLMVVIGVISLLAKKKKVVENENQDVLDEFEEILKKQGIDSEIKYHKKEIIIDEDDIDDKEYINLIRNSNQEKISLNSEDKYNQEDYIKYEESGDVFSDFRNKSKLIEERPEFEKTAETFEDKTTKDTTKTNKSKSKKALFNIKKAVIYKEILERPYKY